MIHNAYSPASTGPPPLTTRVQKRLTLSLVRSVVRDWQLFSADLKRTGGSCCAALPVVFRRLTSARDSWLAFGNHRPIQR